MPADPRRHAPATKRNREPIAAVLRQELPAAGLVLEVASGTGEHAAYLADLFPDLTWQPSDAEQMARASITGWAVQAKLNNLRPPLDLDAQEPLWPITHADAVLCINMVHISPWAATLGLFDGAVRILPPGAPLILYGPYLRDAVETAPSNLAFDIDLRARDERWGLRHLEAVDHEAMERGLEPSRLVDMPANNIMRVYRRRP